MGKVATSQEQPYVGEQEHSVAPTRHLIYLMSRNARNATDFFRLPADRVVEVGAQVEL